MPLEAFRSRLLEAMGAVRYLTLTGEQEPEVRRLRDEKYRSWEWTWGRTPPFSYERTGVFAAAPIRVTYGAKRGIITGASIDSPLIDGGKAAELMRDLKLNTVFKEANCPNLRECYRRHTATWRGPPQWTGIRSAPEASSLSGTG